MYEELRRKVVENITLQLERKEDDYQEGLFLLGPPGIGKSSIIREVVYEELPLIYDRTILDFGKSKVTVDVINAWEAVKKEIIKAAETLNKVENEFGEDAKYLFSEEAKMLIVSNSILNFHKMVKAIVVDEGNVTLAEYYDLLEKKKEIEKVMDNGEITEELVEEYERTIRKLKTVKIRGQAPLVFYDSNISAAFLSDLSGMNIRILGTIMKLPPLVYILLKGFGGVVNFDEISNISDYTKQSALYKIVLDRKIGDITFIPQDDDALGVAITATGNTTSTSTIATTMSQALLSRFEEVILPAALTEDDVLRIARFFIKKYGEWSITGRFVSVFSSMSPTDILNVPDTEEYDDEQGQFPTPRGYEFALKALAYINGDIKIRNRTREYLTREGIIVPGKLLEPTEETRTIVYRELVGRVGASAAERFATKWILETPRPEELYENPEMIREVVPNVTKFMITITDYIRYLIMKYANMNVRDYCSKNQRECGKAVMPIAIATVEAERTNRTELINMIFTWADAMEPGMKKKILQMSLKGLKPLDRDLFEKFRIAYRKSH